MEEKKIRISMLQMSSIIGDVEANCEKVKNIILENLDLKTDVLILPEVWTVGWECSCFRNSAQKLSNSSVISFLKNLAKRYEFNIIGGSFITEDNGKYYNTCPVISKEGELITTYSKNHLFSYYGCDEGKFVSVGESPVMVELEGIKFGLTICYDIRFPEIYRAYRLAGADVLVNCAAWGSNKPIPWEMLTKSRAIENQCYFVALTQSGKINETESNLGQSRIIDYKGDELASIMSGEGIITANLSMNEMYEFRDKCTVLNDIRDNYEVKVYAKNN